MKNFVILMKDNQSGQAYFFDFEDGVVYRDDQSKLQEASSRGASLGVFVGMICIGVLGGVGSICLPKILPFVCTVCGFILGLLTYYILNQKSYLNPEYRQALSKEQILELYEAGKGYRKSYFGLCIGFGLFSVGASAFLFVLQEWILVICVFLSWWVMGIMIWGIRPGLLMKLRKWLYQ